MSVLNYKELKTEFKKKNFIRFKDIKKKRKVIDATKMVFKDKDTVNAKYWDELVERVDQYKKDPSKEGSKNINL